MKELDESLECALEFILDTDFCHGEDPAIPALWAKGTAPICVVAGENAGGKSFFRRLVQSYYGHILPSETDIPKMEVIRTSMEDRGTGGFMSGIVRSMIYGDEKHDSTGANSSHVVTTGFRTSRGREAAHVLFMDEPDIGASAGVSAGIGVALREFIEDKPEMLTAVFVVSHSRDLLQQLLPLDPHYVCLGDKLEPTLEKWVARKVVPVSPTTVKERSDARFKRIQAILTARKLTKYG